MADMSNRYAIASHHMAALFIHANRGIESLLQSYLIDHWVPIMLLGHYVSLQAIINFGLVERRSIISNGIKIKQERIGRDPLSLMPLHSSLEQIRISLFQSL